MPSSYPENILPIIHIIADLHPKSVMDIGVGRGKFGFLIREYFPLEVSGDWEPVERLEGLDVFPDYITGVHHAIYDKIHIANAVDHEYEPFDMYLMIDIIEHIQKDEAFALLDRLTKQGLVLVSTPNDIGHQGEVYGNKHEAHISQWHPEDFEKYNVLENRSNEHSLIYVIS